MRLLHLYLKRYRVLSDFLLEFKTIKDRTSAYTLDFLVGVNGTGKSTLLRAIAEVFQCLTIGSNFNFGFEISYMRSNDIRIFVSNLSEDRNGLLPYLRLKINDGDELRLENEPVSKQYLPELVIAFTTGNELEWEPERTNDEQTGTSSESTLNTNTTPAAEGTLNQEDTRKLAELYLTELPGLPTSLGEKGENGEVNRIRTDNYLFIKTQQLPLVTLCGLLNDMADRHGPGTRSRLHEVLYESKIAALQGFSLKFRILSGVIKDEDAAFIRKVAQYASHRLRLGTDYLLVYDLTEEDRTERINGFLKSKGTSLDLFRELARLSIPPEDEPILREVNLFLQRTNTIDTTLDGAGESRSSLHLLEWLSDGEQSFLGRLCLFSLLGDTEALILLDEPEVHFNDVWKREIVRMLDEVLRDHSSHVLITSHSSITLTDAFRRNVLVLRRENNYTREAFPPQMETLAADPSDIIVSVFGAPQATGAQSIEHIKRSVFQALRHSDFEKQLELLRALSEEIAPGYWSFLVLHQIDGVIYRQKRVQQRQQEQ